MHAHEVGAALTARSRPAIVNRRLELSRAGSWIESPSSPTRSTVPKISAASWRGFSRRNHSPETAFRVRLPAKYTIVDIDLEDSSRLLDLRLWLELRPSHGKAIFVVEHGVRLQAVQAFALGATDLVDRPATAEVCLRRCSATSALWRAIPRLSRSAAPTGSPQGSGPCKASSLRRSREFRST